MIVGLRTNFDIAFVDCSSVGLLAVCLGKVRAALWSCSRAPPQPAQLEL